MPQSIPSRKRSAAFDLWRKERTEYAHPRKQARMTELRHSHWLVRRCSAGHVVESHRSSAEGESEVVRCPICGRDSVRESHEETANREHQERTAPQRVISHMAEAMSTWAQEHLDAFVWSLRSQDMREQRDHEIGKNPALRKWL